MYHCHIYFYLTGCSCNAFEMIKETRPYDRFVHEFLESDKPEAGMAARADVIFFNLQGTDGRERLQDLLAAKKPEAELILLTEQEKIMALEEYLPSVEDIWIMPMTDTETGFRIRRWMEGCKREKDAWQTSHFLDSMINNTPNLIWFKDKDGVHEKVNDSFCATVNKTKKQVEGQRHAYIWDVEEDDPACIESEREVMSKKKTCISEETIKTGGGMRLLTTYKSPLYDLDGSVMGTVGVAIDITQERAYEREIVQKNQTLETIFTTIDCGVMRHSVDGTQILSVNRAALNILGYETQEELMDGFQMVAASVMDEDKGKLRDCIKKLGKPGDSVSVEYRVQHKNGEILHVMGNVKLLEEDGKPFYQRFLLDCTAQKLKEKKNEHRQKELIQALGIDYNLVCFFDFNTGRSP